MSTLTQAAILSKKASVWAVIATAAIIFLMIFLGIGRRIKNALLPPAPLPPTVAFGKLPRMDLSEGIAARAGIVWNLETITGDFPVLPASTKVFGIREKDPSFGTLDTIASKLANVGFSQEPVEVASRVWKFGASSDANRTITVDLAREDFLLESDYHGNTKVGEGRPRSVAEAKDLADGFFRSLGIDLTDFDRDSIETKFLRIDGLALREAASLSEANLIQVIYRRGDLDTLPVLWPREDGPKFYALVSYQQVVEAKFETLPIQKFKFATYPLKGPAAAFEDLKRGRGALNKPMTTSEASIINVTLGYVESAKNPEFLQPVYFFRGTSDFIAYVSAVDEKWIK